MPEKKKIEKIEEHKFKGKFIAAIGKRKTASAQVRLYKTGSGAMIVNGVKAGQYFAANLINTINQPLKVAGIAKDIDFSVVVSGGGKNGQAEAIKLGISRALIEFNEELLLALKAKGLLTRDSRKKERKKPGLKKARKAPQWSKR